MLVDGGSPVRASRADRGSVHLADRVHFDGVPVKTRSSAPARVDRASGARASMPGARYFEHARLTPTVCRILVVVVIAPFSTNRFRRPSATALRIEHTLRRPRRCASFTGAPELMYWPHALAQAGIALLSTSYRRTVTRRQLGVGEVLAGRHGSWRRSPAFLRPGRSACRRRRRRWRRVDASSLVPGRLRLASVSTPASTESQVVNPPTCRIAQVGVEPEDRRARCFVRSHALEYSGPY